MPNSINEEIGRLFKLGDKLDDKLVQGYERKLIGLYKASLETIKREIARMYERYGDLAVFQEMVKYQRLVNVEKFIKEELTKLGTASNIQIKNAVTASIDQSYTYVGYVMEKTTQIKLGFAHASDDMIKAALFNPMDRIKWPIRNKKNIAVMYDTVKGNIAQGLIEGEGYGNTAQLVQKTMNNSLYKALRIVRTEGHRVQNVGRVAGLNKTEAAAKRLGLTMARLWNHSGNPREPRPDHLKMDGEPANKEGTFTLPDGTETKAPGNTGIAKHDIHCGCSVTTEFKGKTKGLLSLKESGEIPGNFTDWQKERLFV